MAAGGKNSGVYVLELQRGFFYVGKSFDTQRRIQQHVYGKDTSYWCKKYGPLIQVHAPITPYTKDMDTWERDELLARMMKHGFHCVRGWQILDPTEALSPGSYHTIRNLIMGNQDLCRTCGHFGHFALECETSEEYKAPWLKKLDACLVSQQQQQQLFNVPTRENLRADFSFKHSHCFRCGRYGHWVKDCFARTHKDGSSLND